MFAYVYEYLMSARIIYFHLNLFVSSLAKWESNEYKSHVTLLLLLLLFGAVLCATKTITIKINKISGQWHIFPKNFVRHTQLNLEQIESISLDIFPFHSLNINADFSNKTYITILQSINTTRLLIWNHCTAIITFLLFFP